MGRHMDDSLLNLYREGKIEWQVAISPELLEKKLGRAGGQARLVSKSIITE